MSVLPSLFTIYCITCNDYISFALTILIILHKVITYKTHSDYFIPIWLFTCIWDVNITLFYTQVSKRKPWKITAKYTQPILQITNTDYWFKQVYFQLVVLTIQCMIHVTFTVIWLKHWWWIKGIKMSTCKWINEWV